MTADDLFEYACSYAKRAEDAGKGTQYPTVRQACKRFRVKIEDVESAVYDWNGDGYIGIAVGIRVGSGVGLHQSRGECQVEAYKD